MQEKTANNLSEALADHQIQLSDEQIAPLERYCHALWQWNEKINLTRHTDFDRFVARDVVDSLALEPLLEPGERILDVGTGGGVPGVPLAILRPDLDVELCESVAKKAAAIQDIVAQLKLPVTAHHARAEDLLPNQPYYNTLVARAVAPLPKLLRWLGPHTDHFARILLIKGPAWVDERAEARHLGLLRPFQLRRVAAYQIPGTSIDSTILSLRPKDR